MKRSWIYLINTFAVQTNSSHKKALILFEDTYSKLISAGNQDPDIATIAANFEPYYRAYKDLNAQKQVASNRYEGRTSQFENVLAEIPTELRKWEAMVRIQYIEDSVEERMIFPNKRAPFSSGTYESRINAIKALVLNLQDFPNLQSLQTMVQTFYDKIEQARWTQQQQEGKNDSLSSLLEEKRIETCQEIYGILGLLMHKFRNNPDRIADFFDLTLLRTSSSSADVSYLLGTVKDANGQAIENATIKIIELGAETYSDADGNFYLELESGRFTIEITAQGYQLYTQSQVEFVKNNTNSMDIILSRLV